MLLANARAFNSLRNNNNPRSIISPTSRIQGRSSHMFCPNCSQAFQPERTSTCPNCGSSPAYGRRSSGTAARALGKDQREVSVEADTAAVDAGVRKGVYLILIGVVFFPVYKVLAWLYPSNDLLVNGARSAELFEMAGQAVLFVLFGFGILRVIYALTVVRQRVLREAETKQ